MASLPYPTMATDERSPLVPQPRRILWRHAAAMLLGVGCVAGAAASRRLQPAALAAAGAGLEDPYAFAFDALIARGLTESWDCDGGAFAYCGSASCSKLDLRDAGMDACLCILETNSSFTFHVDGTVAYLAAASLFARAIAELVGGGVTNATKFALCAEHATGGLYRAAGFDVPLGSWHAPVGGNSSYGLRRGLGDLEIECMGAPCWHVSPVGANFEAGDGGCEVVCLCPRAYVPANNTDDASSSWGNTTDDASSCETHNGDSTTADSPDELALIARHLAANVNFAELEAPCNQCVPKHMPDATRV